MQDFDKIPISVQTIVVKSNCQLDTTEIFNNIKLTPYKKIIKKRGRKNKNEEKIEQVINDGDIIMARSNNLIRGVNLKKQKGTKFFRNNTNLIMNIGGKFVNIKISKNGSIQITGIKHIEDAENCVKYIFQNIIELDKENINNGKEPIISYTYKEKLLILFRTAMTNINFNLGFNIIKENLDFYFNKNTEYFSLLETLSNYAGVNIKMPNNDIDKLTGRKMILDEINGNELVWKSESLNYNEYLLNLPKSEREKMTKDRQNTLLVFQSGSVILSGCNKACLESTYTEFVKIIQSCKDYIEEKVF